MDHPDTAWCPVCDRNILPKRITVQVPVSASATSPSQTVAAAPTPVPMPAAPAVPTKSSGGRGRAGLVHGTGRAKAVRAATKSSVQLPPSPTTTAPPPPALVAMKTKTIIDQSPLPLYCSDECRMADLHRLEGGLDYDFDPRRSPEAQSPPALCAPRRGGSVSSEPESLTSESTASTSTAVDEPTQATIAKTYAEMGAEFAALAKTYNFPALPTALFVAPEKPALPLASLDDYDGGILMAGRRMKALFEAQDPPRKKNMSPTERYTYDLQRKQRKPIPGWTDGSDAWREDLYCISPPKDWTVLDPHDRRNRTSLAAPRTDDTLVRVRSTSAAPSTSRTSSMPPPDVRSRTGVSSIAELYGPNYALFDPSREAKRAALFPGPSSLPARPGYQVPARKAEVPILPPAAQGKLLVPDVKLKRTPSSSSVASSSSGLRSPSGSRSRPLPRRESSMNQPIPEEEELAEPRPTASRQCSADGWPLYEVVPWTEVVRRVERHQVDGVEVDVLIEERVPKYVSSLFLGPDGRDPRYEARMAPRRAAEAAERAATLAAKQARKARKARALFPPHPPPLPMLA